jgi:hypothetical protein
MMITMVLKQEIRASQRASQRERAVRQQERRAAAATRRARRTVVVVVVRQGHVMCVCAECRGVI